MNVLNWVSDVLIKAAEPISGPIFNKLLKNVFRPFFRQGSFITHLINRAYTLKNYTDVINFCYFYPILMFTGKAGSLLFDRSLMGVYFHCRVLALPTNIRLVSDLHRSLMFVGKARSLPFKRRLIGLHFNSRVLS